MINGEYITKKDLDAIKNLSMFMVTNKKYRTELIGYFYNNATNKIYISIADIERALHIKIKTNTSKITSSIQYIWCDLDNYELKGKCFEVIERDALIEIIKEISKSNYISFNDDIIKFLENMSFNLKDQEKTDIINPVNHIWESNDFHGVFDIDEKCQ